MRFDNFIQLHASGVIQTNNYRYFHSVICNFDHSIASMAFVSIGMMYGAKVTDQDFIVYQAAVSLGNMVGGLFVMAGSHALMNHWGGIGSLVSHSASKKTKDPQTGDILDTDAKLRRREPRGLDV